MSTPGRSEQSSLSDKGSNESTKRVRKARPRLSLRPDPGLAAAVDAILREVVAQRALADAHQLGGVLLDAAAPARARGASVSRSTHSRFWCRCSDGSAGASPTLAAASIEMSRAVKHAVCVREHDRALDRVLQLAHVARPVVLLRARRARRRRRARSRLPVRWACFATKCSASTGMSSRRSRSGGSCDRDDVQAVEQILLELALATTICRRSRLVAAMTRTSTFSVRSDPAARTRAPAARAAAWPARAGAWSRSRRGRSCRRRRARSGPSCSSSRR